MAKQEVKLFYTDYSDAACTIPQRSFTTALKNTDTVLTSNSIPLTVTTTYVEDFAPATVTPAQYPGHAFRY